MNKWADGTEVAMFSKNACEDVRLTLHKWNDRAIPGHSGLRDDQAALGLTGLFAGRQAARFQGVWDVFLCRDTLIEVREHERKSGRGNTFKARHSGSGGC